LFDAGAAVDEVTAKAATTPHKSLLIIFTPNKATVQIWITFSKEEEPLKEWLSLVPPRHRVANPFRRKHLAPFLQPASAPLLLSPRL